MTKEIKNTNINYEIYGNKKGKNIVLLHGWGQNIQMMKPLADPLSKDNNVIIIDLPGHGDSSEPLYPFTVLDYVDVIFELLKELKIKDPIFIGHSFGGKLSLLYASINKVSKLVLFGSPFKPEIEKLSTKTKLLKSLKKVPGLNKLEGIAKKYIGSTDYRNASPIMRQILVGTVNLDISFELKKIKCPTLIIWGTLDEAVPLNRAYELESLIENSAVIEYPGCSHYAYLERLDQSIKVIKSFIESGE